MVVCAWRRRGRWQIRGRRGNNTHHVPYKQNEEAGVAPGVRCFLPPRARPTTEEESQEKKKAARARKLFINTTRRRYDDAAPSTSSSAFSDHLRATSLTIIFS